MVLQRARFLERLQPHAPLLEPLPRHIFEIRVGGLIGRNVELRERLPDLFQAHLAPFGDQPGAIQRFFEVAEHDQHFIARLEIELRL